MGHDPQRAAAAYLGGQLGRRQRERFETHLLECEACWGEVQAGRRGRALAESLRELAPQQLRERVRATVEAHPTRPPRRGRARTAAALVALVLAGGVLVTRQHPTQPRVIAAAVAAYQAGGPATIGPAGSPPVRQLGGLRWRGSGRGVVGGLPVVAHTYQDAAGHRVVLLVADRPFPMAAGARHDAADTWIAEIGGVVLFCADDPAPSLLVGPDRARVLLAADRLGLTGDQQRPRRAP
jgi:putative zinc finger protein